VTEKRGQTVNWRAEKIREKIEGAKCHQSVQKKGDNNNTLGGIYHLTREKGKGIRPHQKASTKIKH